MPPAIHIINPYAPEPFLLVCNTEACHRLPLADIMYCTCHNSSTEFIITDQRRLVSTSGVGCYETLLSSYGFIRIHQSYLLNIAYLRTILKGDENAVLLTNGEKLPLARSRKPELIKALKALSVEGNKSQNKQQGIPDSGYAMLNTYQVLPNSKKVSSK